MPGTIDNETAGTTRFGQELEDLVYNVAKEGRLVVRDKNDDLLLSVGRWSASTARASCASQAGWPLVLISLP
jgi:hypothetical protein